MAGIDLLTGQVHALVKDRHRSREFIEFLKMLEAAYPAATAIKIILDNHSAHISQETKTWLAARPEERFQFVFTPKHGALGLTGHRVRVWHCQTLRQYARPRKLASA
jgi:transposase